MTAQDADLPPEAADSQHLAIAFRVHADPELLAEYHRLKDRLQREGKWHYVGSPRNPECYVLSEFDSHGQQILHEQRMILAEIEEGIMSKLRRGLLTVWAREGSPVAPFRAVPASAWRTLKLDDVVKGTAKAPGVSLFDIRVGIPVVAKEPEPVPAPPLPETGAPGRPSHMHLIIAEFKRRVEGGQLERSLAREAATLAGWFMANHPDKQPLTAKAIENKLRDDYREARTKAQ